MQAKKNLNAVPLQEPHPQALPGFSISTYVPLFSCAPCNVSPLVNRLLPDPLFILFPELKQLPFHPFLGSSLLTYGLHSALSLATNERFPTLADFLLRLSRPDGGLVAELNSLPPTLHRLVFFLCLANHYRRYISLEFSIVTPACFFLFSWFLFPLFASLFAYSGLFAFFRLRFPDRSMLIPFFSSVKGQGFEVFRHPSVVSLRASSFPVLKEYLLVNILSGPDGSENCSMIDLLLKAIEQTMFCWPAFDEDGQRTFDFLPLGLAYSGEMAVEPFLLPMSQGFSMETERMDAFFERVCVEDDRPPTPFDALSCPALRRHYDAELEWLFLSRYPNFSSYFLKSRLDPMSFYPCVDSSSFNFRFPPGFLDPFSRPGEA